MESSEIIVAAGQAVSTMAKDEEFLRLFYKDLSQPGVKQVGKALSTVLGLGNTVLLPLKMVNAKANALYTHHMEQFRKKLEQVPEEKTIEAAPEIGVPILENLEKTTNESISQMYINLLANASHIDFVNQAHPRFVSIIESLTHDEAVILNEGFYRTFFITIKAYYSFRGPGKGIDGMSFKAERVTKYHKPGLLWLPERASFYFDNLLSLGLITQHEGNPEFSDPHAKIIETFESEATIGPGEERIDIIKGYYQLTGFGALFMKACKFSSSQIPA